MWAQPQRAGSLRIYGRRGHPVVCRSVIRFAKWLRSSYAFPVRLPVYLSPHHRILTMHGSLATASFFAPWDPDVEPYIRVATGDYPSERRKRGRDNALAGFLCSVAHELVHYQQWVQTGKTTERGVAVRASRIVALYALRTDHP
jgi:hypothetical protein